jgi:anaerobic ribonucleoside-triphosphate reductase
MKLPVSATFGDKEVTIDDESRQKCEVWTRVMGYYRPIENWNPGKRGEHKERKWFKIPEGAR